MTSVSVEGLANQDGGAIPTHFAPVRMDKEISQTFARGLAVLTAFDAENNQLTVPEIAQKTGLNRTVVRRLVLTLQQSGYLESRNHVYRLTPRVLRLAGGFLHGKEVGAAVWPILSTYSSRIGETISFAMLDENEAVYVAHSPGDPRMTTHGFTVGSRLPLFATAIGRTLLAFCPEDERVTLLETAPVASFTPRTVKDRAAIRRSVDSIRAEGYAFVTDEFEEGVSGLAVPVLRSGGELIGALGIAGPNPRYSSREARDEKVRELQDCAAAISLVC